jgi:C4-dicarboxylate-specific signal transduction histidine kinase
MQKPTTNEDLWRLNTLLQITKRIIATLNLDEVLQIISNGMSELLSIETAAIYLLEKDDNLYLGATTPPLPPLFPENLRIARLIDHHNIQNAIISKQPVIVEDTRLAELMPAEKAVAEMRNLRSLLFLPFVHEEVIVGVLILGTCNEIRHFTSKDIEFGQTIANQLAIAIENTRLHADLNHHKQHLEQLVKEKTRNLDRTLMELKILNNKLQQKNDELEKTLKSLKEAEAHLIQSEKMASLGILTAGVAHEINNPLNYIMGATVGLENYFKKNNSTEDPPKTLLRALRIGVENASNIVRGLNQFSRKSRVSVEECNLSHILDNCLLMLNNQFKNQIQIIKEYQTPDVIIHGNTGRLHQVFLNLLQNAYQAIEGAGQVSINVSSKDNQACIEIIDSGKGISKENLSRIMDPFFTTKAVGEGVGLGLFIVYSIISDHGGTINFESKIGHGTKVLINMPVQ